MGHLQQSFHIMKFLVFVALLASVLAEPEPQPKADPKADPWLLYGGYYGHLGYYGYPYAHYGYYGKRSAEPEPTAAAEPNADAKADPWLLYLWLRLPLLRIRLHSLRIPLRWILLRQAVSRRRARAYGCCRP